jgi:hypothetical protein
VLLTGEPLFLRRRHDFAVLEKASGGVMIKSGDTEDVHRGFTIPENHAMKRPRFRRFRLLTLSA